MLFRQRDEHVGGDPALAFVFPAEQGFNPNAATGFSVDDRLTVNAEFAMRNGMSYMVRKAHAIRGEQVHHVGCQQADQQRQRNMARQCRQRQHAGLRTEQRDRERVLRRFRGIAQIGYQAIAAQDLAATVFQTVISDVQHHPLRIGFLRLEQKVCQQFNIKDVQDAVTAIIIRLWRPHDQGGDAFGDRQRRAQRQLRAIVCYCGQNSAENILAGTKQAGTVNNTILDQQHCPKRLVLCGAKAQCGHDGFTSGGQQGHGAFGL